MGVEQTSSEKKEQDAPRFFNAAQTTEGRPVRMLQDERAGVNVGGTGPHAFVEHKVMIFKAGWEYMVPEGIADGWFRNNTCELLTEKEYNALLKKAEKNKQISEDELNNELIDVQELTDGAIEKIDKLLEVKEKEVMEV